MVGLEPISDEEVAEVLADLAGLEALMGEVGRPTWFELLAAAAFRYFADRPVDVAVVEVGMGGRWDATNIADGVVSIVTNVALDHTELLGPTREHIAGEKAGIIKPGATLVLGRRERTLRHLCRGKTRGDLAGGSGLRRRVQHCGCRWPLARPADTR